MRILVRCDGGPDRGVGHAVRSIAMAEEAVRLGHEVFLMGALEGQFLRDLAAGVGNGFTLLGPGEGDEDLVTRALDHDVLHVDHYELPTNLLQRVAEAFSGASGPRSPLVSVLADGVFGAQPADLLIDPTVGAQWASPPAPARWHLRGGRFAMLRRAVLESKEQTARRGAPKVLVVMGGTDPAQCAPLVVEALRRSDVRLEVTVVSSVTTAERLLSTKRRWRHGALHVVRPTMDLPAAMADADLVVSAAGTSMWELCALRRAMAVVAIADNQQPGYDVVVRAGAAIGLGTPDDLRDPEAVLDRLRPALVDADVRTSLAETARPLVDGRGAWRVVRSMEEARTAPSEPVSATPVKLRLATTEDARALFEWRNDPRTRAMSRDGSEVTWEGHLTWLRGVLEDGNRRLLVGTVDGTDVGTVRWDAAGADEWEVSITVAPEARGRRLGVPLLRGAEQWLASRVEPQPAGYLAVVHAENAASRRLFIRGGYVPDLPAGADGFERFVRTVR